jgi:hypothetical protein
MSSLPWWLVTAVLVALAAVVALWLRAPRTAGVPLADVGALERSTRRTTLLRVSAVIAIGAALAAAYLAAPRPTGRLASLVSPDRTTVVVLDLSQSVSDLVYREIARTLEGIVTAAGEDGRVGLVVFSDVAQEALPPGTAASHLQPFIRYFRPRDERGVAAKPSYYRAAGPTQAPPPKYPLNPWFSGFSGGTQISTGLRAARISLARSGANGGRVVLLSDLAEDDADLPRLARELVAYERDPGLELRVVALPPATAVQKQLFARVAGDESSVVDSVSLATGSRADGRIGDAWPFPFLVAVLALALTTGFFLLRAVPIALVPPPGRSRS